MLDSEQGRWLAADLAGLGRAVHASRSWHEPRFSSGVHGNDNDLDDVLARCCTRPGADVIVNGHDHDYERFAPQDPDAVEDRERGIREFVVGTGGITLRPFEELAANSELRAAPHVRRHEVHAPSDDATSGSSFRRRETSRDSGSAACH